MQSNQQNSGAVSAMSSPQAFLTELPMSSSSEVPEIKEAEIIELRNSQNRQLA